MSESTQFYRLNSYKLVKAKGVLKAQWKGRGISGEKYHELRIESDYSINIVLME